LSQTLSSERGPCASCRQKSSAVAMALRRGGALILALLAVASAHDDQKEGGHKHEHHHKGGDGGSSEHKDRELQLPTVVMTVPTLPEPMEAPTLADLQPMAPMMVPTISWDRYDCFTGFDTLMQISWPGEQKEWCCEHKEIGCAETSATKETHNCEDVMEALIWSDQKRMWCCEHRELGCSDVANNEPFDCNENLLIWSYAWSDLKQDWCCKHAGNGCKASTTKFLGVLAGSESWSEPKGKAALPFDCADDANLKSWSDDKKAWCCGYSGKGCEEHEHTETETTTTLTTTTMTTTTNLGCRTECEIDGVKDTCLNFVQQSSISDFLGEAHPCSEAYDYILAKCPACDVCTEHDAGCNVLEGPTTTTMPPTTTPEPTGCYKKCLLGGIEADCRSRIQWSAEHLYFWNQTACHKAYDLVMGQCDPCGDCVREETGCEDVRAAQGKGLEDAYDCDVGYENRARGWSAEKKEWCCKSKAVGCGESEKKVEEASEKAAETVFRKKFDQTALRQSPSAASEERSMAALVCAGAGIFGLGAVSAFVARRAGARSSYRNVPEPYEVPILE